ncbi:MAG: alpha-amylase family glycosyl hydrolase, partial [Actinomycetota bacterium]|nr:alpha-amylase family glycosyl hydrolase [Actinomycetota bacterium]
YQIYPRSFADSNGDGQGDLRGVIEHLDHLEWLGVDGIWLSPINSSPQADWGYDVADYLAIDSDFGSVDDLERLVADAGRRGIRVLMDLVPNHTSDRHPWFLDARSSRSSEHREWYVWADAKPDGSPPNNWRSSFGGPAWTWDETTEQYYLHLFLPEQPDLNWWEPAVVAAFEEIVRFWFDRGISGFRIDVAHALVNDRDLRDDSIALETDDPLVQAFGLRSDFSMNRPEGHEIISGWRAIADSYEPRRILLGETWVTDLEALARFYGSGEDELHLALNVPFEHAVPGPLMREVVERTSALLPEAAWPLWNGSNHDAGRFPTRWCDGDERGARAALVLLLGLRGTPLLYYGDEIGMRDVEVPRDRLRDPVGVRHWPENHGRDGGRTPMQWTPAGGFGPDGVEPWLPMGDAAARNVADQRADRASMLHLCRDLIALRRTREDLHSGTYEACETPDGVWAWRRGTSTVVAVNHSDAPVRIEVGAAEVLLGTERARQGEKLDSDLVLDPWEAAVIAVTG